MTDEGRSGPQSPLPWKVEEDGIWNLLDADGVLRGEIGNQRDAEAIVTAVNAHHAYQELVAAVQVMACPSCEWYLEPNPNSRCLHCLRVRAALAKATGR